ncbi:MAG: ankyrin repeat domain-containing protein [Deltaproteobacteria bacterium]|nr:ankyrin repeat domain-containing protein [Deltaproteobacteria bacterium]
MHDFDRLLGMVYRRRLDELERAAQAGARFDVRGTDGRTLVLHAVLGDAAEPEVVRWLLARGAEVDVADAAQRWTALHHAARDGKVQIVDILLQAGATVDAKDMFGNTPLWRCVANGDRKHKQRMIDIARLLLAAGADPRRKNNYDISPIDCETKHLSPLPELLALLDPRGAA